MGIFRIQTVGSALRKFCDWGSAHRTVYLAGLIILAGCVADSTLPSQNVGVLLSPGEVEKTGVSNKLDSDLAIATPQPATTPTTALSPTVKNALIPSSQEATPAQTAVTDIAKTKPASQEINTQGTNPATNKQGSLFGSLFSNNAKNSSRVDKQSGNLSDAATSKPATTTNKSVKLAGLPERSSKQSQSRTRTRSRPRIKATLRDGAVGLPGVRIKKLFGIDTQETEEFDEPLNVANVPNLARRGTHGLLLQRPDVKVGCFPRKLLTILKRVERRFGRTPIVTSGYRSPSYNRRVRGARNSTHIRCHAADIQVKGVSKWTLAKYLRTIPGRGGVGTYCHTRSVHVDIGKKRAWHYCKRRRKKRRRS